VVIVPQERLDEVVAKAEEFYHKEEQMVAEIRAGVSMLEVDNKFSYEKMLK
jgi:regulator of RNase E activity RraA